VLAILIAKPFVELLLKGHLSELVLLGRWPALWEDFTPLAFRAQASQQQASEGGKTPSDKTPVSVPYLFLFPFVLFFVFSFDFCPRDPLLDLCSESIW
jgi:hypothetical protein